MQANYKISSNDEILEALHPVPQFENRDDIKPWIHERLDERGINLVIERSDASKVVFKCKNIHRKTSTPRSSTTKLVNGKTVTKRVRTSPDDSCPFRLRVSYSVKHKVWAVNIIKPEHNMALCSNFSDGCGISASSTPSSVMSTKRSWASTYTPASTTSPVMSITDTPESTFTPASEMDFDFEVRNKKARLSYESPLSHEIDPLEKISLSEDLNDLNHLVASTDLQLANPTFNTSLDFSDFNLNHSEELFSTHLSTTEKLLDIDFDPTPQPQQQLNIPHHDLYSNLNLNPKATDMSLDISGQAVNEADEDPLMYMLSNSNSSYSIEELENLDKAMGIDANDQFLMSMFNKM